MWRSLCTWKHFLLVIGFSLQALLLVKGPQLKRGFFCGDPSISFKYNGDRFPNWLMMFTVFSPLFYFLVIELVKFKKSDENQQKSQESSKNGHRSNWKNLFFVMKNYLFGLLINFLIALILKHMTGELRPHFFDTCRPDAAENCTAGSYIEDYKCMYSTAAREWQHFTQSTGSFPSGHASLSIYSCIFLSWYTHSSFRKRSNLHLLAFLDSCLLLWASFAGFSRIIDNRHHPRDVWAGFGLGIAIAIYTCVILCRNFSCLKGNRSRCQQRISLTDTV